MGSAAGCQFCGAHDRPTVERKGDQLCEDCAELSDTIDAMPTHTGSRIRGLRTIVRDHQAAKIDGYLVDATTASMLVTVYDALKPSSRAKFGDIDLLRLVDFGWKQVKLGGS